MRKAIRASVLIMALAIPAFAGNIPNDVTAAGEIPNGITLLALLMQILP